MCSVVQQVSVCIACWEALSVCIACWEAPCLYSYECSQSATVVVAWSVGRGVWYMPCVGVWDLSFVSSPSLQGSGAQDGRFGRVSYPRMKWGVEGLVSAR